jgi:CheY-like chemotaxis protein
MSPMPDKTILIVDDTPANIAAALAILKDQYRTKVATGGAKALEHARAGDKPDLILLDVTMPEMDGYEVCGDSRPIRRRRPFRWSF